MTEEDDGSKTTNARRSRAERAKAERERRKRSTSRSKFESSSNDVSTQHHTNTNGRDRIAKVESLASSSPAATIKSNGNEHGQSNGYRSSGMHSGKNSSSDMKRSVSDNSASTGTGTAGSANTATTMALSNTTSTSRIRTNASPIRERMEELRSARLAMVGHSRSDMSPTGRMRLEQQHAQKQQQQLLQQQLTNQRRRNQQLHQAQQTQNMSYTSTSSSSSSSTAATAVTSQEQSNSTISNKNVDVNTHTSMKQKNYFQNRAFPQQQQAQYHNNHNDNNLTQSQMQQQQDRSNYQQQRNMQQKWNHHMQSKAASQKVQSSPTSSSSSTITSDKSSQQQQQQQTANTISSKAINTNDITPSFSNAESIIPTTSSQLSPKTTNSSSIESPLPPLVHRALGDRSYDKRKNAALEVEALVKHLADASISSSNSTSNNNNNNSNNLEQNQIYALIQILSKEFCMSVNSNFRKGGLIGLAATGIGLMSQNLTTQYLEYLINPVIHCFDDPEARVRYYACESLYNIVKVARKSMLKYFNLIFDGLTKLFADVDDEVKNGANLLDRLVKDIVTESDDFNVNEFLPLLQNYIRRTNPYIRQLLVGWITVLDGIPDVSMLDYLPDFLDGLFNMLADSNREIRQAADSALCEFLKEIRASSVVEFRPLISILVFQCHSKDRLNRLTALTWLNEFMNHPYSGGDKLLSFHAEILSAVLSCISDSEVEIRKVSDRTNSDLLNLVKGTKKSFELAILLDTLTKELAEKEDVPTKMASLKWINMLLEQRRRELSVYTDSLLPFLLQSLSDSSDSVVLLTVQVLSRITLSEVNIISDKISETHAKGKGMVLDDVQFVLVIKAILSLFASDRRLLETRGSLIVRRLCVLLNAKSVYTIMAEIISSYDITAGNGDSFTLEFVATMIQTLNLILLTASELHHLRKLLETSFAKSTIGYNSSKFSKTATTLNHYGRPTSAGKKMEAQNEGARVFAALFHCWCNNPVSTFSLCLLARAYDLAFALVKKFSEFELTVGFLMQIDKLATLLESPVFVHIRLQLLDVETPYHTYLLKSCYGLLMLLPQSDAFQSLNDRLAAVCNLRDNLGVRPAVTASPDGIITTESSSIYQAGLDAVLLLKQFDDVMGMHRSARDAIQRKELQVENDFAIDGHEGVKRQLATNKIQQQQQAGPSSSLTSGSNQPGGSTMGSIKKAGIGAVIAASGIK